MKKFTKTMMLMAGACALGVLGTCSYNKKCELKKKYKNYLEN